MAPDSAPPVRLMNFVSEEQLDEAKKTRGVRVEDGTAERDRPLYEILKENKDKRDAEFNERFKTQGPPKSLDEDETEFLENLEMSRREYERQMADDEEQQIQSFQAAVAAQSNIIHELKEPSPALIPQESKTVGKKTSFARSLGMMIKVKPQTKKQKIDHASLEEEEESGQGKTQDSDANKSFPVVKTQMCEDSNERFDNTGKIGLVTYSDESDDDY